jgi:hypothetical protein
MKVGNWRLALGIMLAGGYMSGCAQNVPDIDRTSPNKVEKKHFLNDDEWYYRQTMIDTDQVANAGGGYPSKHTRAICRASGGASLKMRSSRGRRSNPPRACTTVSSRKKDGA